jgi:hypothetical protein
MKFFNKHLGNTIPLLFLVIMGVLLTITIAHKSQEQSRQKSYAQVTDSTELSITVFLDGIGNAGDSVSPSNARLSNKNPDSIQKDATVSVYNQSNQLVMARIGRIVFDYDDGAYIGVVDMGNLQSGTYILKIKMNNYLQKRVTGTVRVTKATRTTVPAVILPAGDINNDNKTDILDYNILRGCYSEILPATFCDDTRFLLSDISNDGYVDALDYNLLLREFNLSGN